MTPRLEVIAMLNNMFESHDGRPVEMAVLHRRDYEYLLRFLLDQPDVGSQSGDNDAG